ncbi:MAG: TIGR03960 family B12-binding radical SAM protein [Bacillota bacterium]
MMNVKEKIDDLLYKIKNPERYIGNEWNSIVKKWDENKIKVALAFPDVYEIGMSHLGMKIIYHLLNKEKDILCERSYSPWFDMENLLKENNLPLYALESGRELNDFDVLGFTLQYEMSYTNILNILDLANIPIRANNRDENFPLIIAGGATVFNPEPLAPFIDLFYIGEAEEMIVDLIKKYKKLKDKNLDRQQILLELSKNDGVYVPSLYNIKRKKNGYKITTANNKVKENINRQIVADLDNSFYPTDFIVPYMDIVHNRAVLEIARGCTRGCRFCAAGMTYRPVRERSKETLLDLADKILKSTGYGEISLTSLSSVDHSQIKDITKTLVDKYKENNISISLSSLRVDEFSVELAKEVQKVKKTGLTFAPEAGTQRLRDVINKGVNEENLYEAAQSAFESGWHRIKLYFMIALPTETKEDLAGIVKMAKEVLKIGKEVRKNSKKRMRNIEVQVSVSTFIPKPFTPFQWVGMPSKEEIENKISYLQKHIRGNGLKFSWNDSELSLLEGLIARGDRKIADVIENAWEKGAKFDGWSQYLKKEKWFEAIKENNIKLENYTGSRDLNHNFPWEHINTGLKKEFLKNEYTKSFEEELTKDCSQYKCVRCDVCHEFDVYMNLAGAGNNEN